MKTLLLLRHAKSDWGDERLVDFDRPLAKRGLKDAPLIGNILLDFQLIPDKILSSPARRAKQTTELVAKACGYNRSAIAWHDSFYGASSEDLLNALHSLPDSVERAMLVGHNPTMEETVEALLIGDGITVRDTPAIRMPTAALACFDLPIEEWTDIEAGIGTLRWFLVPKLVRAFNL